MSSDPSSAPPPRLLEAVLKLTLPRDGFDDVLGDLQEEHALRCERRGRAAAGAWYLRQSLALGPRFFWEQRREQGLERSRERMAEPSGARRRKGDGRMGELTLDLRHSARALWKSPAFTLGVVAILALGLGANIMIFSVFDTVLLRPMGFHESDRLSFVWPERAWFTKRELVGFREASEALDGIAGYYLWSNHTLIDQGGPEMLRASLVTANFFSVLGVTPLHGRSFLTGEDQPGADKVVVLSHGLWQRRFGGDPDLVGRTLDLDSVPTTVVGVMPPGFSFRSQDRDLWVPMEMDPAGVDDYNASYVQGIARLRDGVSRDAAVADTRRASVVLWEDLGITSKRPENLTLPKFQDVIVGDVRPMLVWLLIAVGSLLLIASVNVANLLLTRGAGRQREVAIRAALGCGRWRLARWLLAESLLLALAGGILGFLLARLGLFQLVTALPDWIPRTDEIVIDGRIALAGLGLSLLTGFAFGFAPAVALARARVFGLLREGAGAVRGRSRARGLLVVAEVAVAFVLVTAAGLAARSFWHAIQVDPGFETAGVHTFSPMITDSKYDESAPRKAFFRGLESRLGAAPGLEAVGAIHMLPIRAHGFNGALEIEGREVAPDERPIVNWRVITPGYFDTLGIPRKRGRFLDDRDRAGASQATLINEAFAERYFADQEPLGKRIRISLEESAGWLTVVGVVGDIHQNQLTQQTLPEIYRAVEQVERQVGLSFLVRSALPSSEVSQRIREAMAELDPHVPVAFEESMASILHESLSFQRLIMVLTTLFALLAMVLGAAGIYGVVAFDVSRRTPEIGLRMALGAHRGGVLKMILRQGLTPVGGGLLLGVALSLAVGRFLQSLLFGVEPGDPATYLAMLAVLGLVASLAVLVPALNASRVDPLLAIRHE